VNRNEKGMNGSIVSTKRVVKHGTSLGLNLTRELKLLGADYGDEVVVMLKRCDEGECEYDRRLDD